MRILVLNAGSSSQKSRLYEIDSDPSDLAPTPLWQADADWADHPGTTDLKIATSGGVKKEESLPTDERAAVIEHMLQTLWSGETRVIDQLSTHCCIIFRQQLRRNLYEIRIAIESIAISKAEFQSLGDGMNVLG